MEALPAQQRQIMDALSRMDEAASPSNLSLILKLKLNQVTAIINTLVANGYLKPIAKGKKKGTFYYDVAEQLFRIWYQIRSSTAQKKRFEWLIRFIELWYLLPELKDEHKKLASRYTRFMEEGQVREATTYFEDVVKYAMAKPEKLQEISKGSIKFYLERITQAITDKNIGTTQALLSRIIAFKQTLELHKIPEKETGFNQLLMDFIIQLLKGEKAGEVVELLDILDRSEISKYTGFLFPLRILAQYLQTRDEDILNRQKPEVKGIIKEVLAQIR